MKLKIGSLPHGRLNKISDVPGVLVGHTTIDEGNNHTGVTALLPLGKDGNPFQNKLICADKVFNGYGKTLGLVQIDELGTLETPVCLTNTLNVGIVHDAVVEYMILKNKQQGINVTSINPVVCECNDSRINDIQHRAVNKNHVFSAIENAAADFEEGSVGAGRGTICYGMKGGIGSSSRIIKLGNEEFHIGVLVQSNYGASADFMMHEIKNGISECDTGSIIIIIATDLPVSARQMKRIVTRASVGMARLGSYIGNGSGEIAIGFTTANVEVSSDHFSTIRVLNENDINLPFRAVGEATEEAIIHSLLCSHSDITLDGKKVEALCDILKKEAEMNEG